MPLFKFQVADEAGNSRSGRMTAQDLSDAERRLKEIGRTILKLEEVKKRAPTRVAALKEPLPHAILAKWHILANWQRLLLSPVLALFLGLLGFGWAIMTWNPVTRSASAATHLDVASLAKYPVKLDFSGKIELDGTGDYGDVQIVVDIPEIPYQLVKSWSDLEHPSAKRFLCHVEIAASTLPGYCYVRALKPGYDQATSPMLDLKAQRALTVELRLPRATRTPQARRPKKR